MIKTNYLNHEHYNSHYFIKLTFHSQKFIYRLWAFELKLVYECSGVR